MIFGTSAPKIVYKHGETAVEFTVNATSDTILKTSHGLRQNDQVTFATDGTLPGGLSTDTTYYVINPTDDTFQVATSKNGTAVDITDSGTGTHTYNAEQTILLDYVAVLKDEPEIEQLIHKSEISGHREYVERGEHWLFRLRLHLFKYSDPRSKFEEIYHYKRAKVTLWRHRDGSQFLDSDGNDVLFMLEEVTPAYLERAEFRDVLILTFRSTDYVDFADDAYTEIPQLSDIQLGGI